MQGWRSVAGAGGWRERERNKKEMMSESVSVLWQCRSTHITKHTFELTHRVYLLSRALYSCRKITKIDIS